MNRNVFAPLFCCFLLALASGCDQPNKESAKGDASSSATQNTSLAGSIAIEGSSTVEPISNRAKEKFNSRFPNVNLSVSGQGTGNGFKALAAKECDVSDGSRPIKKKELDSCTAAGVEFFEIPVAYDGLTIVINNDNDFVKQLSVNELKKIFREDTAAKTWNEVNPDWPSEKISIYAPGIASGTHDYFVEVIGKKDNKGLRADEQTTLSEDDKLLVTGVKGDKFAIGFFGYGYYESSKSELKAVPIVNEKGDAITPSMATIESGEYAPFSRPLFIYVNTESYQRAEVREFVDFYLNDIVAIAKDANYVPLPTTVYELAKELIAKEMSGTHYVDEAGEKRSGSVTDVYKAENLPESL